MTISWLLHLHQPAIQDEAVVIAISNSSYRPLLAILRDNSNFKVTLSISGTLIEWWQRLQMTDIIETLSLLVKRGQVELVGTGFCHPILTLLPKEEVVRQIQLGGNTGRHGFFSPEMAVSNDLIKTLSEQGYEWVMADEVAALGRPHFLTVDKMSTKVIVRDRGASLAVAFGYAQTVPTFTNLVENYARFADRLVLAMDGETFGHHWPQSLTLLTELAGSPVFEWATVSESITGQTPAPVAEIQESTWGTSDEDLVNGVIYPKWKLSGNEIHKLQWELLGLAINVANASSRQLLDHALGSDQFWWASKNPYWHPGMVQKGAKMLLEVVKLAKPGQEQEKRAESLYNSILYGLG